MLFTYSASLRPVLIAPLLPPPLTHMRQTQLASHVLIPLLALPLAIPLTGMNPPDIGTATVSSDKQNSLKPPTVNVCLREIARRNLSQF